MVQEGKPWKRESHYLALEIEAEVEEAAEISSSASIIVKVPMQHSIMPSLGKLWEN